MSTQITTSIEKNYVSHKKEDSIPGFQLSLVVIFLRLVFFYSFFNIRKN